MERAISYLFARLVLVCAWAMAGPGAAVADAGEGFAIYEVRLVEYLEADCERTRRSAGDDKIVLGCHMTVRLSDVERLAGDARTVFSEAIIVATGQLIPGPEGVGILLVVPVEGQDPVEAVYWQRSNRALCLDDGVVEGLGLAGPYARLQQDRQWRCRRSAEE